MSALVIWSLIAGLNIVAELLTGTLYLLVIGIAAGAAAGVAALDLGGWGAQLAVFSIVAVVGCSLLRKYHRKSSPSVIAEDVGTTIPVIQTNSDGTYRVRHRGTEWDAILEFTDAVPPIAVGSNLLVIGVRGNRLVCKPA